ncbi:MAG TPA: histidine--tRNA ligase [Gemmatimonadales bacterium]|nr:histidine--tRNA ligase [Gemmatimonadales bacterium]
MQFQALPGFRDFFPADLALRSHIFATWRSVAARYGYEEYDGPPLEALELYTAKSGDEIVGQLYNFVDKGGREVSLRPEMTPTLARMVAARANGLRKPIRWFAIPQLFRHERQQRGRLREHFQLNCDLIGETGPLGDAEVVALALDVLRAFGFTSRDVRVRLSDRRVLAALLMGGGVTEAQLPAAYAAVDKIERMSRADLAFQMHAGGLSGAAIEHVLEVAALRGADAVFAALERLPGGTAAGAPLRATMEGLGAMGLGEYVDLDLTIVRGLAYYTGTVFELFDAGRSLRAICGGGRYDNLLQALGGVDLPAAGFGMGDVVLAELLKEHGRVPEVAHRLDAYVVSVTPEDVPHALALVHELRDAGFRVSHALQPQAVGRQLTDADARGARAALVVGPDDRVRGEVQLKDLAAKAQRAVARGEVAAALAALAGDTGARPPLTVQPQAPTHG